MDKPHLVLNWLFDIPNQTLSCKINDYLEYIALEGGTLGFIKKYRTDLNSDFVETEISPNFWSEEKFWISENFGEEVGYFQPDYTRVLHHPVEDRPDPSPMGVGPDGRYIDHLQRMQIVLEGYDCARIGVGKSNTLYITPDNGKTIFKREKTRDVNYPDAKIHEDWYWFEHPQPCAMQPRSPGYKLSSIDEMLLDGIDSNLVEKCKKIKFDDPEHPKLQKWFVYPTV
jgi:hypothetical protein